MSIDIISSWKALFSDAGYVFLVFFANVYCHLLIPQDVIYDYKDDKFVEYHKVEHRWGDCYSCWKSFLWCTRTLHIFYLPS